MLKYGITNFTKPIHVKSIHVLCFKSNIIRASTCANRLSFASVEMREKVYAVGWMWYAMEKIMAKFLSNGKIRSLFIYSIAGYMPPFITYSLRIVID